MSKKSNALRRPGCRRVRRLLQAQHDREEGTAGLGAAVPAATSAAVEAAAAACELHLRGCPACRRFQEFLAGYGRELAVCLEALYTGRPGESDLTPAAGRAAAGPAATAGPDALDAPVRRALSPAARWAIAAAAALLVIAAGAQLPRFVAWARVQRRIQREVVALVEAVYSRSLAQGVETALSGEGLLEGLAEGDGLQGLGEGEDFLAQ